MTTGKRISSTATKRRTRQMSRKRTTEPSKSTSTELIRAHHLDARDIRLAKGQSPANRRRTTGSTNTRKPKKSSSNKSTTSKKQSSAASSSKKATSLSKLLTPKNMQETVKTVTNLRGMVKNWLGYLQQADKMLDTVFVTTSSLKESGVLDKIVKQRGKNLSTEDFTSILAALMSSPMASSFLGGGSDDDETSNSAEQKTSNTQTQTNTQAGRPQQNPNQMGGALPPGANGAPPQQPRM